MKTLTTLVAAAALGLLAAQAYAGTIPYPNTGTVVPPYGSITAGATGLIDAWAYGSSAGDTDYVRILDVTQSTASAWIFNNQTTAAGTEAVGILAVHAGDVLEFQLCDVTTTYGATNGASCPGGQAQSTLQIPLIAPTASITPTSPHGRAA